MHALNMTAINTLAEFVARKSVAKPAPKARTAKLGTYAWFLDVMCARKSIMANPKRVVRAARLGAYRRKAKPYTLGQVRAHITYRRTHQPEIYATYCREARAI